MNSIAAENRELALSISINQRNPCHHCTSDDTGYYLALTFGTLLSSQGADAQQLHPRGLHCWLGVQLLRRFPVVPDRDPVRRPSRAARRRRNTTRPPRGSAGTP